MEFCVDSIYRLPFSFQNQEKWQEELKMHRETVDENDISEVVSMITGIPVNKIAKAELKELNNLNNMFNL